MPNARLSQISILEVVVRLKRERERMEEREKRIREESVQRKGKIKKSKVQTKFEKECYDFSKVMLISTSLDVTIPIPNVPGSTKR